MQIQNELQGSILGRLPMLTFMDLVIEHKQSLTTGVANEQLHIIKLLCTFWK